MRKAILLLFLYTISHTALANESGIFEPSFEHIAVEDGLSNYNVGNIAQDSLGYLWMATSRGLNRYDGQVFKLYLFDPESPGQGVPHDFIQKVMCAHNRVFVNTGRGVVVLNQKNGKWHKIASNRSVTDFIFYHNKAYVIFNTQIYYYDFTCDKLVLTPEFEDKKGLRFISNNNDLLCFIGAGMNKIYCYDNHSALRREISVTQDQVRANPLIFNQYFIVKLKEGVRLFKIVENELTPVDNTILSQLDNCNISTLLDIDDQHIAIATMGDGLYFYDFLNNRLEHVHSNDMVSALNSDFIKNLFFDVDGNFWVSTFDKGLNVDYNEENKFNPSRDLNLKTKDNFINCIRYNSYERDILFGTRMNGIISKRRGKDIPLNNLLKANQVETIISLFEDSESKLWIGGIDKLLVYDQKKKLIIKVQNYDQLVHIEKITEVDGQIYMVSEKGGVNIYSLDGKNIRNFGKKIFGINDLLHTSSDLSYFCSIRSGLYVYNRSTNKYKHLELKRNGKPYDWEGAVCLNRQDDSTLWIGTLSWGLIKVNINTLACKIFTKNDGLPGNDVTAIEIDDKKRLWLSTSDGLSCMHEEGSFVNFSAHEGVNNYQFHRRSALYGDDGFIYFGGNNGLSYFDPSQIELNRELEGRVVLESLMSNGVELTCGDETGILAKSLPYTSSVLLPHNYSNFTIRYTIPLVFAHDQIKYAYKLEGWDEEWRESFGSQTIDYTNLPSGKYVFKVKACRHSSLWTPPTSLDIELKSAPWFSWWAFLLYFILVAAVVSVIFALAFYRKVATSKLASEQLEHQRENEINEIKYRFFTNISHELRTPLTIIYAISNISVQELDSQENVFHFLRNLRLNTERLKRMVDQLLTFRNLELDTLKVDFSLHHIDQVINRIAEPFLLFTQQKKITFSTVNLLPNSHYIIDRDKFEKILNNLLDNAIKYTPQGGRVEFKVQELTFAEAIAQDWDIAQEIDDKKEKYLLCEVTDSGIGIEEEALSHIFDRYYKASSNVDYSGTGIGLNFVKRLIELQDGHIKATSCLGEGTCVSYILPLFSCEDQILEEKILDVTLPENANCDDHTDFFKVDIPDAYKGKTLLIIEDDISLNNFLYKTYENSFKVYSAYNSHEGLILAKNTYPDLIISDVMMGEADEGLKFCATIKKDSHISHIPVILLTARAEKSQILEGYAYGADAYVTKPFDIQILSSQIISLLENRERLQRDMFSSELVKTDKKDNYNQNDIVFIKKINEVIFDQYYNPEFNITSLSKDLLISRSAFYKKFTQVTKLTPNDYLRKYRIKKAVELMENDKYSITQIVEMVGFNSRSGFYSSFKKEKNMTPSEFIKANKGA